MTETVEENKSCIVCGKETNGEVLCKDHVIEDLKYHVEELERSISKQEEEIDSLAPRIAELEAQLEWKDIKDAPSRRTILISFKNELGKVRVVKAFYAGKFEVLDVLDGMEFCDYHEESDQYFWPEGWYEDVYSETGLDYSYIHLGDINPSSWKEVPTPPQSKEGGK